MLAAWHAASEHAQTHAKSADAQRAERAPRHRVVVRLSLPALRRLLHRAPAARRDGPARQRQDAALALRRHARRHRRRARRCSPCSSSACRAAASCRSSITSSPPTSSSSSSSCTARRRPSPRALFFIWTSVFNLFAVSIFWALHGRSLRRRRRRAPLRRHRARRHARRHGRRRHHHALRRARRRDEPDAASRRCSSRRRSSASIASRPAPSFAGATPILRANPSGTSRSCWRARPICSRSPRYMFVYTITSTFAYLEQARLVQASVHGDAARTALFARMDLAVNLASIVLQASLTALLLRRAGVTATLLVLPDRDARRIRRAGAAPVADADRRLSGGAPHRRLLRGAARARALLRRRRARGEVRGQELHRHLHLPRRRRARRQRLRPRGRALLPSSPFLCARCGSLLLFF